MEITEYKILSPERIGAIALEINAIRKSTLRTVLSASCEIGGLLIEAKDGMPHGEWCGWLEKNFAYSQTTANNLMRLYENYGDREQIDLFYDAGSRLEIFGNLTPSQALALLPLPEAERVEYVETHDMSETSVREIENEIKARKAAEELNEELMTKLEQLADEKESAISELEDVHAEVLREKKAEYDGEVERLKAEIEAAKKAKPDKKKLEAEKEKLKKKLEAEALERFEKERAELSNRLSDSEKKKGELEKQIADAGERIRREIAAEYEEKLSALEAQAKNAEARARNAGNSDIQRFSVFFDNFQRGFSEMLTIIERVRSTDAEKSEKLRGGLSGMLADMMEAAKN